MKNKKINPGSFRDPNGYIFEEDGQVYRLIKKDYKDNYNYLISSNLYNILLDSELLIRHEVVDAKNNLESDDYIIIKPDLISFISYPYECSFSQ